jgi:hypothetical protein
VPIENPTELTPEEYERRKNELKKSLGPKQVKAVFPNATNDEVNQILSRLKK